MLLLAGLIGLALYRVGEQQQRHESLNRTFATVAALEHAQSDLALLLTSASTLAQTSDPQMADATRQAVGALEEHLGEARASALAQDDTVLLADLDNLIAQIGVASEITQQRVPDLIAADRSQSTDSAAAMMGELSPQAYAIDAGLDRLVREQQDDYAAAASAANRVVDVNLRLLVAIMVAVAAAACATVAALLLPVFDLWLRSRPASKPSPPETWGLGRRYPALRKWLPSPETSTRWSMSANERTRRCSRQEWI